MSRVALPMFLFLLLTAQFMRAQGEMPAFQLPFACGQLWQIDSYDATHTPALDMVRDPDSDRDTTEGQPVLAPADGTVNQSFYHNNAGNMIQIDHGGGWFTTYLHLQSRDVEEGDTVFQGEQIGRVGHTGPTSNGVPHLHYELAFDSNGDGEASWGEANSERVPAWFDGVEYGAETGETHNNVASNNCPAFQEEPPPVAEAWDSNTKAALAAWECPIEHVCFWNRPYGTGSRCIWDVADPDWLSGSIQCSWADTDNVMSVFNNSGPEGGHDWTGVVFYKQANSRDRVGCTRNFHAGNLAGTYKIRSHEWTTGRCG